MSSKPDWEKHNRKHMMTESIHAREAEQEATTAVIRECRRMTATDRQIRYVYHLMGILRKEKPGVAKFLTRYFGIEERNWFPTKDEIGPLISHLKKALERMREDD